MIKKEISLRMNQIVAGDHMVLLYKNSEADLNIDVIVDYIISRISKNEKCIFIKGDLNTDLVIIKLKELINLNSVLEEKQLLILDKDEAYSKHGEFDAKKMIQLIKELTNEAIGEGFSALAITGEISWVLDYEDGFERIMEYEYLLNNDIFRSFPVSAICRYNIDKFSSKMVKNIIRVHPLIIYRGIIHENPYYFELVDPENVDIDKYKVESMLKAIENYSSTKSRFRSQIETKEKQYQALQLNVLKDMIITLTDFLEIHDAYTKNHSQKVAHYARKIAQAMSLSNEKINQIYYAGLVHDIGKALIPKNVLNKSSQLTASEYEIVKMHPSIAFTALAKNEKLKQIAHIVLEHHERWDGFGYPNNVKGEDILLESRILCIADAFEAMTSDRPYRKAFSKEYAAAEILDKAGMQFDPVIAKIAVEKVFK